MSINIDLLKKICTTPGAPGFEKKVRDLVLKEIESLVDEVEIDNIGHDFGSWKDGLESIKKTFDYYIFMNDTVRGPFFPRYIPKNIQGSSSTIHVKCRQSSRSF